jgi:malic enzyme
MRQKGTPAGERRRSMVMLDSRGLVFEGRAHVDDDKRPFALGPAELAGYGFAPADRYDLATVVRHVRPTVLIGTCGQAGAFTEAAIRELAAHTAAPIVLPLSNPTAHAEATPADVLAWSEGRALVATGSPFPPVESGGRTRLVGQANNVFIFPGVGLGAIAAGAREVTDRMFLVAATTLAGLVPAGRIADGALYPRLADLRQVSRAIALAVAEEAVRGGVARLGPDDDLEAIIEATMWTPDYQAVAGTPSRT